MVPKHYIKESSLEKNIRLVDIDKYTEAHAVAGAHRHAFYELVVVRDGSGFHEIDFVSHRIHRHSVSFLAPGQIHTLQNGQMLDCEVLIFNDDLLKGDEETIRILSSLVLFFHRHPVVVIEPGEMQQLHRTLDIIRSEIQRRVSDHHVIQHATLLLLHQLRARCNENNASIGLSSSEYLKFIEQLEHSYRMEHSVSYYAERLSLDLRKLNELVRSSSGESALQIIHRRLLLEAKRLLLYSNSSIKEIAEQLGFLDTSYFSRFFFKNSGLRPMEFRKQFLKSTTET